MWMIFVIIGLLILGGGITIGALKTTHFPGREDAY
jgi:hypothetical protein